MFALPAHLDYSEVWPRFTCFSFWIFFLAGGHANEKPAILYLCAELVFQRSVSMGCLFQHKEQKLPSATFPVADYFQKTRPLLSSVNGLESTP